MAVEFVPADRPRAFVLTLDGFQQSYVDLDDPGYLAFDYVRRIGDVVDAKAAPAERLRVLHIGGAALTLPRYIAHTRPRSAQVVLEPDGELTEVVRQRLPLPRESGIKVRSVDGRTGLTAVRDDAYDLVIVDAFADGRVPGELVTTECIAEYARVLAGDGLLLLNVIDGAPFAWTRRVVAAIRTALPAMMLSAEPATLRARRPGNLLVVAATGRVPLAELRSRAASGKSPYRVLDAAEVSDRFGGGRPFTDVDAEASPPSQG